MYSRNKSVLLIYVLLVAFQRLVLNNNGVRVIFGAVYIVLTTYIVVKIKQQSRTVL